VQAARNITDAVENALDEKMGGRDPIKYQIGVVRTFYRKRSKAGKRPPGESADRAQPWIRRQFFSRGVE
jgi:hypothetical protein